MSKQLTHVNGDVRDAGRCPRCDDDVDPAWSYCAHCGAGLEG
jgi:predicted amidophosphoribosyltransferase